ncbi:3,4-dihydroxy-2-butanone-4-phosphate synthase [Persicobacter psychrovividus]|uniref:3,4-dihydroxy-2-butanone 4-phosphate synthase n=1 Tax=Persicobacter psychrovividus TaxID=387638 RepID=A0ABN6L721_9BACT|nr:3,4-dihydroxy-2-butanone 4-phosphate synthase [Persicobacter psychrovividus]
MKTIKEFDRNFEARINEAIAALKAGRGVLVMDDFDRENEGDIIFPAQSITPKDMALMIRETSGIVCLCLTHERCEQLQLPPMVLDNNSKNQTAFTVTIEAKEGVTTGVSAKDRVTTIQTAVAKNAQPEDLARPGHVFPLRAHPDGVFGRRGHTEGSIDLVKLAGLGDSAVLAEVTLEDGTMAKLPEIIAFSEVHDMPVLSIEDIFQYRKLQEKN